MVKTLFIAIGGSIGALLRFFLSRYIGSINISSFPYGTFIVNSIGCFFIGFFYTIFERISVFTDFKGFLLIGLLGAFTTFSTYILETFNLFQDNEILIGLLNLIISNLVGLLCLVLGIFFARLIFLVRP